LALQQGQIFLEDAIDIREIKNIKLANQILKFRRIKKEEQDQAQEQQMITSSRLKHNNKQVKPLLCRKFKSNRL
jgi:hypothetical protein